MLADFTNPKCDPLSDMCFWYGFARKTHADASAACARHGGTLAVLDTERQFDLVVVDMLQDTA